MLQRARLRHDPLVIGSVLQLTVLLNDTLLTRSTKRWYVLSPRGYHGGGKGARVATSPLEFPQMSSTATLLSAHGVFARNAE